VRGKDSALSRLTKKKARSLQDEWRAGEKPSLGSGPDGAPRETKEEKQRSRLAKSFLRPLGRGDIAAYEGERKVTSRRKRPPAALGG